MYWARPGPIAGKPAPTMSAGVHKIPRSPPNLWELACQRWRRLGSDCRPVRPAPADSKPCTRRSAFQPADESAPPALARSGTAAFWWCRTTGRSVAALHTPCSHSAPGVRSSVLPAPHPARRGSCAAGGPFLPARWSPARNSHGSPAHSRTRGSADAGYGFSGCCSSSKR